MISVVVKFVKGLKFCKEIYSYSIGFFVFYYCVEIFLYKKCIKYIYKLININIVGILLILIRRWNFIIV